MSSTVCSVSGQYGRCEKGNCLAGVLPRPSCATKLDVVPPGAWVASWVYFPPGASLSGAAAVVPVGGSCSTATRRVRLTEPDADPFAGSPEGVPSVRELTLLPGEVVDVDGYPWVGAREDGLLKYPAGFGTWVEVEVPAGGCAAACADDPSDIPTGFLCSGESGGALTGCEPSAMRWIVAPLGFALNAN